MKLKGFLTITLALIVISTIGQTVNLSLKLPVGNKYQVVTATEQTIQQDVMGQKQNVYQYHEIINTMVVDGKTDDQYTVEYEYADVVYKQLLDQREIVAYNSKTHEGPVPAEAKSWANLLNKKFNIIVKDNGDIIDVNGIDDMLSKMVDEYEVNTDQDRKDLKERLEKQFGKQNIKDMVEPMYDYLPGKSVNVGDSWKESRTIKSTFEFTLNSTYTLKSIEGDKVTVEINSELSTGENGSSFYQGGNQMTAQVDGTQNGTMIIDRETGLIMEANMEQDMTGEMVLEQAEQSFSIPMQLETSIAITTAEL
ncbi:MAG: hypothetical protein K9I94_03150 [Bacteroidales bacterium]|nr:hypothetical protein [Bacteroidales bacterium]